MNRISLAIVGFTAILSAGALSAGALAASVRIEASAPLSSGQYQRLALNVAYDDLDITTADGATALYKRIDAASHVVCGEHQVKYVTRDLEEKFASCRKQAVAHAVASVNAPSLNTVAAGTR